MSPFDNDCFGKVSYTTLKLHNSISVLLVQCSFIKLIKITEGSVICHENHSHVFNVKIFYISFSSENGNMAV